MAINDGVVRARRAPGGDIRERTASNRQAEPSHPSTTRRGRGLLTFFAVGCPNYNKLLLLTLGDAGALRRFKPVQPLLALAGIVKDGPSAMLRRPANSAYRPADRHPVGSRTRR